MADPTPPSPPPPPPPRPRRGPAPRTLLASGLALALGAGGVWWLHRPATTESTDDAYVSADATAVAPRVRGFVTEVLVRDNQPVRAGAPLVRIDAEEYDARIQAATAALDEALAGQQAARAALVSLRAEQRLAAAQIVSARTAIRATAASEQAAAADARRYGALVASGAVAARDADRVGASAVGATQDAARARALLAVSEQTAGVTDARRDGLAAALATATAHVASARAALDLAGQDRRHAEIRAPIDGVVGARQVRPGDFVQPGTRLLTLVPLGALYVTANFKETQTARMLAGQAVRLDVDALPDTPLQGVVDSIAPGSGSSFALLPFEPGTGNFTKIVQRVPVRIRFAPGQPAVARLRPGLSVTARVRLAGADDRFSSSTLAQDSVR